MLIESRSVVDVLRCCRFYKKLGFQELFRLDDDLYLGFRFSPIPGASPRALFGGDSGGDIAGNTGAAGAGAGAGAGARAAPMHKIQAGVIEGFYGRPWSSTQRAALFEDMDTWGLTKFMYGPKVTRFGYAMCGAQGASIMTSRRWTLAFFSQDDKKIRASWRELYTTSEVQALMSQIGMCCMRDIEFMYAIAPGLDMTLSSAAERKSLAKKLDQVCYNRLGFLLLAR